MSSINISKKSFISSVLILFFLIIIAGLLTRIVPPGSYERILIENREVINPDSFSYTEKQTYPIWKWFTAPIEILWSEDSTIIIAIITFLLVIGGAFSILNRCELLKYIISKIVKIFGNKKYYLLATIVFIFMMIGSVVGIFEEIIPLVPIIIALSYSFGWDSLTGLGMSVLAAGFGFASGISNPFTVGVAQKVAGLPIFSGILLRMIVFVVIYFILCYFLIRHAKRIEKDRKNSPVFIEDKIYKNKMDYNINFESIPSKTLKKATYWFGIVIIFIFVLILSTPVVDGLSDYTLPLVGLLFLIGGIGSGLISGLKLKEVLKTFLNGVIGIAPGVVLILMASSVKHIITQSGIMDTILYYAAESIATTTPLVSVLLVYLLVLIMNFFISSGSAKAFLIMPIVTPLADIIGINRQITVLAFTFGDGFSNVLYPTNAVLLISLGLTVVSYPKWFKWIIKLQLIIFLITCLFLMLALAVNYGPF